MATQIQQLRGTAAELDAFVGAPGVITVDETTNDIRVHDGSTPRGIKILGRSEPARTLVTQAEAETGTATTVRAWTAQRVRQNARKIISYGSNSNGGFIIFDGGLQLCLHPGFVGYTAETTVTGSWPAAFNGHPWGGHGFRAASAFDYDQSLSLSSSGFSFRSKSTLALNTIQPFAIGWAA